MGTLTLTIFKEGIYIFMGTHIYSVLYYTLCTCVVLCTVQNTRVRYCNK